ncbi:MAG: SMI1/KNR4 family protein [Labilithrix sp.]|nr:SMI1/KNR4 family protein [Labilithrix sp.]MCW5813435.1 SMI1/KNR4 family protein [Labilithrix sp.]
MKKSTRLRAAEPAPDVDDVVRRLERLTKKKNESYRFGTRLAEEQLRAFEDAHGVTLPEEYRAFLQAAGEGASGPDYGLVTLAHAIKERGETIYGLADPFPIPASTADLLDFAVGGILPVAYGGCSYFTGIVTTGPARGTMWFSVEARPGWVPCWKGALLGANGKPYAAPADADPYRATYDAALDPVNEKLRLGFAGWYAGWLEGEERKVLAGGLS